MAQVDSGPSDRDLIEETEERARKACLACRQQKVKCIVNQRGPCRRCRRLELQCLFQPRKNAAASSRETFSALTLANLQPQAVRDRHDSVGMDSRFLAIFRRLDHIESTIGLDSLGQQDLSSPQYGSISVASDDAAYGPLADQVAFLRSRSEALRNSPAWGPAIIKRLWHSFHTAMPGLHFLPGKQVFTSPVPLLFASILYCSSSRGDPDVAVYASVYHESFCREVASLVMPTQAGPNALSVCQSEEGAYQTILGLILAALLNEGSHNATGLWISVGYRIMLEQCPPELSRNSRQWQKVFSGLQILDLEHSSIHLLYPSIPLETSLNATRPTNEQLYSLSRMMHVGLSHFAGRGLPTIWSYISSVQTCPPMQQTRPVLSGVDAAVIRDWARQLDEWLTHFSAGPFESETERKAMYRQYVMHRLCVLSIYLPSRHEDIFSKEVAHHQRYELLYSARATIRLHADDTLIWGNWDMIMITWSALILLQAIKVRQAEPDDVGAIRTHLSLLRLSTEPTPNLRHTLADRLERELEMVESMLQEQQEQISRQDQEQLQQQHQVQQADALLEDDQTIPDGSSGYPFALFDAYSLDFVDRYF